MTGLSSVIAEHVAQARQDLGRIGAYPPGDPAAFQLATSAFTHATTALVTLLDALLGSLEPPPPVPGLPDGYTLEIHQNADAGKGERRRRRGDRWAYRLTGPDGREYATRHLWVRPGDALGAGIRAARASQEETRLRAGELQDGLATRVDVYGIANPEID